MDENFQDSEPGWPVGVEHVLSKDSVCNIDRTSSYLAKPQAYNLETVLAGQEMCYNQASNFPRLGCHFYKVEFFETWKQSNARRYGPNKVDQTHLALKTM